jgi:hypothetical protein
MRYVLADLLYRLRFPGGGLRGVDFRPNFDGYLLNAVTLIPAGLDDAAVEQALTQRLSQSYWWMRCLRFLLSRGDRVQYCLGTKRPRQQYLKAWSSWDDLARGYPPRNVVEYWRPETGSTEPHAGSDGG